MKDNGDNHFKFVHHIVSANDMNEAKMEYAKFGKVGLKNCVILSHNNILQRAHYLARFRMKKHPCVSLCKTLFHMCKSQQFYLSSTWVEVCWHGCLEGKLAFLEVVCE